MTPDDRQAKIGELGPELEFGAGGGFKAGVEWNIQSHQWGTSGQIEAGFGAKATLGGGYFNVGGNTGYINTW